MVRLVIVFALLVTSASARSLTSPERDQIDKGVLEILAATGAPSASIAIVRGAEIVYEHAYGTARIDAEGSDSVDAVRDRIGQQTVHCDGNSVAGGRRQTLAGR